MVRLKADTTEASSA